MSALASLLLGAALGGANAAVALLVARRASRLSVAGVLGVVVGGGLVRMAVLLGAVVAVLLTLDVARLPFVAGLGVVFVAGLLAEVAFVARRPLPPRPPATA